MCMAISLWSLVIMNESYREEQCVYTHTHTHTQREREGGGGGGGGAIQE